MSTKPAAPAAQDESAARERAEAALRMAVALRDQAEAALREEVALRKQAEAALQDEAASRRHTEASLQRTLEQLATVEAIVHDLEAKLGLPRTDFDGGVPPGDAPQ